MKREVAGVPFPFTPYAQQYDLMAGLLECYDSSGVGVFESPTGTGKSLSVICSSMYWLRNRVNSIIDEVKVCQVGGGCVPSSGDVGKGSTCALDWFSEWIKKSHEDDTLGDEMERKFDALAKYNAMLSRISMQSRTHRFQYQLRNDGGLRIDGGTDEHVSPKRIQRIDSRSSIGTNDCGSHTIEENFDAFSPNRNIHESDDDHSDSVRFERAGRNDSDRGGIKALRLPQIYYCSRTHSQLSQFVKEMKRTVYADARCVTLGSRKNLCVNENISSLGTESAIAEKCLELQVL